MNYEVLSIETARKLGLVENKLELLLNDLKLNEEKEKKDHNYYFNTQLFAIRVKEILKILKEVD